jgi:hypothetical protein
MQRAPVVENGRLLGVLSVTDILMRGMPVLAASR